VHLWSRLARLKCPVPSTIGTPIVLRSGPYRLHFFSHGLSEPPHIHVDRDDQSARFWIAPVSLAQNLGFSSAIQPAGAPAALIVGATAGGGATGWIKPHQSASGYGPGVMAYL